jgi:hypothetical protein
MFLRAMNRITKLLFMLTISLIIISCATKSNIVKQETVKQKSSTPPETLVTGKDELKKEAVTAPETSENNKEKPKQDTVPPAKISGIGKDELLKWFSSNMKYASTLEGFMDRREQQINFCLEKKIPCTWIIGSAITNSQKGYVITFKDNEFTVEEFPAGKESDYDISEKDLYFKIR